MTNELFEFTVRGWDKPTHQNGLTDTAFKVKKENGTLYIAFQYTNDSIISWLWDLFVCRWKGVHAGFMASYLSVYLPLRREIKKNEPYNLIHFTGFSKGGALAQIANSNKYLHDTIATSYAAPMWHGKDFRPMGLNILYEYGGDIVCSLPPKIFGYKKTCTPIRLEWKDSLSFTAHSPGAYRDAIARRSNGTPG